MNLDSNQDDQVISHYSGLGNVQVGRDALGRMTSTWGSVSSSSTYDGLGHLVGVNGVSPGTQYEVYGYDAIGNRNYLQRVALTPTPGDNGVRYQVLDVNGKVHRVNSDPAQQYYYWLDQNYDYDAAGNASSEASREYVSSTGSNKFWSTRSYYGADEKLRVFNRFAGLGPNSDGSDRAHLGVYEEYWYDALGRRIQVRSRRDAGCNAFWPECPSAVNRFVWDGDQVLMERRVTGSDTDASWLDWSTPNTVAYAHMGGIDAPVAAFKDGVMVVPHADWRGEFVTGHAVIGTLPVINWPGQYEALDGAPSNPPTYVWFGDMLTGYTDGSGQKYMRNRYYDPVKGTFTQKDPIGLAGGLNLYGYADGDAVNFSDPFGLWPCPEGSVSARSGGECHAVGPVMGMAILGLFQNARAGVSALRAVVNAGRAMGTRYMGEGEAALVERTGTIPAVDRAGRPRPTHYTTDAPTASASAAQAKYLLPQKPTHMVQFPMRAVADNTATQGAVAPGATQAATSKPINSAGRPIPLDP